MVRQLQPGSRIFVRQAIAYGAPHKSAAKRLQTGTLASPKHSRRARFRGSDVPCTRMSISL
ncbi:MAG TPA: hypothetical protein VN661_07815 [Candidatus Acidoferrales bacterium]|nr:hypothetical protein [Candidatus Acidoferrales bacterium]